MADKKTKSSAPKSEPKSAPAKAQKEVAEAKQQNMPKKSALPKYIVIIAAIIVIVILAIIYFYPSSLVSTVPFSTFKANLQTSNRISIAVSYTNQSQLSNETSCFTSIIQVIAHSRKASTIDFFIIDRQSNTCTYSTSGLGGNVNPITTNSSYCLGKAYGEDGLFLNYSVANSTDITASHMFIYGNNAYLAQCPIAIELS